MATSGCTKDFSSKLARDDVSRLSKQQIGSAIGHSGGDKLNIVFDNTINNNFASYKTLNY